MLHFNKENTKKMIIFTVGVLTGAAGMYIYLDKKKPVQYFTEDDLIEEKPEEPILPLETTMAQSEVYKEDDYIIYDEKAKPYIPDPKVLAEVEKVNPELYNFFKDKHMKRQPVPPIQEMSKENLQVASNMDIDGDPNIRTAPYVIDSDYCGELMTHDVVYLYLHSDGIITDDMGYAVEDLESKIGPPTLYQPHFDYAAGKHSVSVRNDVYQADYEIELSFVTAGEFTAKQSRG